MSLLLRFGALYYPASSVYLSLESEHIEVYLLLIYTNEENPMAGVYLQVFFDDPCFKS